MKKSRIQENQKNLNIKPHRNGEGGSTIEDHKQSAKISKNNQFTGNSLDQIQREYYPQSRQSSQTSCSIVLNKNQKKFEHEQDQTKASKDKSNNSSSFSTKAELENEIERLNTQLDIKDQKIKNINQHQQSRKSEIIELNKNLNFHKGRIDLMEAQLRSYEDSLKEIAHQCDEKSKYKSQVEQLVNLFQGMRKQNQILNGKYQQKSYQLNKLTQKYIKLKQRLNKNIMHKTRQSRSNSQSNSQKNEKLFNSTNSLSKRVYEPSISQKTRKNYIWTLQAKIQSIQTSMEEIVRQNQRLNQELADKQNTIIELTNKLEQNFKNDSKITQNALKNQKSQRKVVEKKQGLIKILKKSKQNLNKDNKNKTASKIPLILRKLRYHLIGEQLKYQNLLQILVNSQINPSTFNRLPYGLNEEQSLQLSNWINKKKHNISSIPQQEQKQKLINILRDRITFYKNLSIRLQHNMKILIFNQYLNRQNQMIDRIKQSNITIYSSAQEYFAEWGLRQQQIDIIFKCYYQETGQIEWINLQILRNILLRWKNI